MKDALAGSIRAVVIAGSPRPRSNSLLLANKAVEHLEEHGIDVELIELRKHKIHDCYSCRKCVSVKRCCIRDDMTEKIIPLLLRSHIIIIVSPVYFDSVPGLVKRFIDRTWCIRGLLKNRVLGGIVVGRGYGLDMALATIHNWGLKHEMILCHRGARIRAYEYGEALRDDRGLSDLEKLCDRVYEVASLIYSSM